MAGKHSFHIPSIIAVFALLQGHHSLPRKSRYIADKNHILSSVADDPVCRPAGEKTVHIGQLVGQTGTRASEAVSGHGARCDCGNGENPGARSSRKVSLIDHRCRSTSIHPTPAERGIRERWKRVFPACKSLMGWSCGTCAQPADLDHALP